MISEKRKTARAKAEQLVAQMTVEEAASQLRFDAPAIPRLNIPAYNWWNEALHGVARGGCATGFPQAIGMAASFDPELIRELGDIVATEGRAKFNAVVKEGDHDIYKGLTFWSPNINIFRDPRWGRGHETYGEDPYLTATLGSAYVKGIQGEGETLKAAACAKHFAVHSGPESLRHSFNARVSDKDLYETYLPAFKTLVQEADVEAVMGAYNRTNDEPCCGSQLLLQDILRQKWGFEGHVVSDCWAVRDFHESHHVTPSPVESCALALNKGCDVNCGCTYQYVLQAYQEGKISEETIRKAAIVLFTTRYRLGIMGEGSPYDSIPYEVVECAEHIAKAKQAALEGCVLLKNNGLLPLKKVKTLGVIGPNANSRRALVGNYHGTSSRYITVLEGLQDALEGQTRVLYSEGCHLFKDRVENLGQADDRLSEAVAVAHCSDAVVLVLGLDETLEGEEGDTGNSDASGDKRDLLLPQSQQNLMEAVLRVGKPTVICLMAGSSIDLGPSADAANAILLSWYPGPRGGAAVADILLGKVSPSGKLPVTFYRNEQLSEMPAFTDYSLNNRTYRYFSSEPAYPFGFGLTYGKVVVEEAKVSKNPSGIEIEVHAANKGSVTTEDVIQVYVQNEGSVYAPKNPRLCAFQRALLPAGETIVLRLNIPAERLLVTDEHGELVQDGKPVFYVHNGQPDSLTEKLSGSKAVEIRE